MNTLLLHREGAAGAALARRLTSLGLSVETAPLPASVGLPAGASVPALVVVDARTDPPEALRWTHSLRDDPKRALYVLIAVADDADHLAFVWAGADDILPAGADDGAWAIRLALAERRAAAAAARGREVPPRTVDLERNNRALVDEVMYRKAAEEALRQSEARFRGIFDAAPTAIVLWDREARIVAWNRHAEETFGWTFAEVVGRPVVDVLVPQGEQPRVRQLIASLLAGRARRRTAGPCLTKGGHVLLCEWNHAPQYDGDGVITGALSLGIDVTERRELEERLRRSEKLEAIGQLAGGIAHDFNNQLVGIQGYASLIAGDAGTPAETARYAEAILRSAGRSADLVSKLLAFARKSSLAVESVDVHDVIDEVVALLEHSIDKRIVIERAYEVDRPVVQADPTQLHGALLNLGLNARDAMPSGGTLRFATGARQVGGDSRVVDGGYVRIVVSDTGIGMDAQTVRRVFEPFFTTKEGGTGMGLAAVYGTIQSHGGAIDISSGPGAGTSVDVLLPLENHQRSAPVATAPPATAQAAAAPVVAAPAAAAAAAAAVAESAVAESAVAESGARILVVDDEPDVRDVFEAMLRRLGHVVTTCEDGAAALAAFRSAERRFDLVILDVTMPGLSGSDVYAALRAIDPDVRVLLTSGFAFEHAARELRTAGMQDFLGKPFSRDALARAVTTALSR